MKKIVILGSTGSIGENALKVVQALPGRFQVVAIAASGHAERIAAQAAEFGVEKVALMDGEAARRARTLVPRGVEVLEGMEGLSSLASLPDVDLVVCAIVGMAALKPVLAAITAGHDVAIATKEVLVAAGELVCGLCHEKGVSVHVTVNTLPAPGSLLTVISPPIISTSLLVMVSPRPVPP